MTEPFPDLPLVTAFDLDDGPTAADRTPKLAPEPSSKPVLDQNATWLARTMDTNITAPAFVDAGPPPPHPLEATVERPSADAAPTFSAATVSGPTLLTTEATVRMSDVAHANDFTGAFTDAPPVIMNPNPNPTTPEPGQIATAVALDDLPVIQIVD